MSHACRKKLRVTAAAVAAGAITAAGAALAMSPAAAAQAAPASQPVSYQFTTLDNQNDTTFNQLLGINDQGTIAGYFGSGAQGAPNKGYLLFPPDSQSSYRSENFPGSVQTQVTGLNAKGATVGFWSSMNNANQVNENLGFYKLSGHSYHSVQFPTGNNASPVTDQLLGVNDHDIAAGFYTNSQGSNRGYTYNIRTRRFSRVWIPGFPTGTAAPGTTAAAINDNGDIAGFWANPGTGDTDGFLLAHGKFTDLAVPGAASTQALGVSARDEVVGDYTVGTGSNAVMHGFTWTPGGGFTTVDDPDGIGTTTINGVNDKGDLVGFYVDGNGNTDGFLATPAKPSMMTGGLVTLRVPLSPMPQGMVTIRTDDQFHIVVSVSASGLTPGSSHEIDLVNGPGGAVTQLGTLTADSAGQLTGMLGTPGASTLRSGSRVLIRNGTAGDPVSAEIIAESSPTGTDGPVYQLSSVEMGPDGTSYGTPQGSAVLTYDPAAQTISVTVNASGLTPGAHAAHIHDGSCMSQGAVQYMLMDFTASSQGQIVNQTRTVTGVTSPVPSSGWYLNLHQGDSDNILSNGSPTINFRPLLCGDIVSNG
jgi:hypothetical protein